MKLLLLFLGWCVVVLLCWVAVVAAALLWSAGVWLAWGVERFGAGFNGSQRRERGVLPR